MKKLLFFLMVGAAAYAANNRPTVLIAYPSSGQATVSKQDVISVVVEKGAYLVEGNIVADSNLVAYVNGLLKTKPAGMVCVYVRPDLSFGDVLHGVDQLRETNAVTVALSRAALPYSAKL